MKNLIRKLLPKPLKSLVFEMQVRYWHQLFLEGNPTYAAMKAEYSEEHKKWVTQRMKFVRNQRQMGVDERLFNVYLYNQQVRNSVFNPYL